MVHIKLHAFLNISVKFSCEHRPANETEIRQRTEVAKDWNGRWPSQ